MARASRQRIKRTLTELFGWRRPDAPAWAITVCTLALLVIGSTLRHVGIARRVADNQDSLPSTFALATFFCGFLRAAWFHPTYRRDYLRWLELSPWTARQALPLGPILLTPYDCALVVVMAAASVSELQTGPFMTPLLFLGGYLVSAALFLLRTGQRAVPFAVLHGLAASAMLKGGWGLGIAALLYCLAAWAFRRSLAGLPWTDGPFATSDSAGFAGFIGLLRIPPRRFSEGGPRDASLFLPMEVGWPQALLSPVRMHPAISWSSACAVASLSGLWFFVFTRAVEPRMDSPLAGPPILVVIAILRLCVYLAQQAAPTGLRGRWALRQPLIPGFDVVFLAPLAAVVLGWIACEVAVRLGASAHLADGVTVFVGMLCALGLGPTYETWALTGLHRLRTPAKSNKSAQFTQPQ